MNAINDAINYWLVIEPYVYISLKSDLALLYNTLDGQVVESDNIRVVNMLKDLLLEKNCGVLLLKGEDYENKDILDFVETIRDKFMGDIIDVSFSNSKPVQTLPYCNYSDIYDKLRTVTDNSYKSIMRNLLEVNINIDHTTNISDLIFFLISLPERIVYNIFGDIKNVPCYSDLVSLLVKSPSPKYLHCSYFGIEELILEFGDKFNYKICVDFPIDHESFNKSIKLLLSEELLYEFVFRLTSEDEYYQTEQIIKSFAISNYKIVPIYNGSNISFFEDEIYLTKDDILSSSLTLKELFIHQSINVFDFGKITIMPNGDIYANVNHPKLGNILDDCVYEIVKREIQNGISWYNIRNQYPCNNCLYQWLCPSPSDYEVHIGKPNLCHL